MLRVELVRWNPGMRKVSCTQALQTYCNLGLSAAKATTDALLEHKQPIVTVASDSAARQLILSLVSLGVVARFAKSDDYDPQERFESALALVGVLLPPLHLANCRALSAHGEWELALSHCLAALSPPSIDLTPAAEHLLSELVVEFGLAASASPQNGA